MLIFFLKNIKLLYNLKSILCVTHLTSEDSGWSERPRQDPLAPGWPPPAVPSPRWPLHPSPSHAEWQEAPLEGDHCSKIEQIMGCVRLGH